MIILRLPRDWTVQKNLNATDSVVEPSGWWTGSASSQVELGSDKIVSKGEGSSQSAAAHASGDQSDGSTQYHPLTDTTP